MPSTSPRRGEVDLRSKSGEGPLLLRPYPLTPALSPWEREFTSNAAQFTQSRYLLVIGGDDIAYRTFQLLGGRALAHQIAEGRVTRHLGIAQAPHQPALGIEPDQSLGVLRDTAKDIGTWIEIVGSSIAQHDHGGLRRHARHPLLLEI